MSTKISSFHLVIVACIAFTAWYYFNKFQESEKAYCRLHADYNNSYKQLQARVSDLQAYKDDVSKTFQILDNELLLINNHIKKNTNNNQQPDSNTSNITNLSPTVLNNLLNNMNSTPIEELTNTSIGNIIGNNYDKFLLDKNE